jgi:hypothetical protein
MKKGFLLLLISVFIITIFGCSNQVRNANVIPDVKTLEILKNDGTDNYKQLKKISDTETINKVVSVLRNADWENAKVKMSRPPDFKINNLYDIWISPQKNRLEVVIEGESKYVILSKEDSQVLYEIITGEKLSE